MKIRLFGLLPVVALMSYLTTATLAAPAGRPNQSGRLSPGGGQDQILDFVAKELHLTASQKLKFANEIRASSRQRNAIISNQSLSQAQKRTKLKLLDAASEQKVKATLTPVQRTKLDSMMKMGRPGNTRLPRMRMRPEDDLHLTPAQNQKAAAIMKDASPRFQAIMKDKSLSRQQKDAKLRVMGQGVQKRMDAILTPEQRRKRTATMKRIMAERRARMNSSRPN